MSKTRKRKNKPPMRQKTVYFCRDCKAQSQHWRYEFRRASPPRCGNCGGTLLLYWEI